jgi:hypothetical protein
MALSKFTDGPYDQIQEVVDAGFVPRFVALLVSNEEALIYQNYDDNQQHCAHVTMH